MITEPSSQAAILTQFSGPYLISWNILNPASVYKIRYEMSPSFLPSLTTSFAACVGSTCVASGLPVNWIV